MRVWWAGLISGTGTYAMFVALPVYLYAKTDSTLATGFGVMINALPLVLVGQVAGVLVDRWPYRRTMLLTNLLLFGLGFILLLVLSLPWWAILPFMFLKASVGQFLGPAENALLPTLVREDRLAAANSLNALNNNLARLIGPAVGGVVMAFAGFAGVILLDALSYLVAALLIRDVKEPERERAKVGSLNPYRRLVLEWRGGIIVVRESPVLKLSFLVAALVGFGEGFISTLTAPFLRVMLDGGSLQLGYLFSAQAIGGITAGLLLAGFADRLPPLRLLAWGGLVSGLLLIPTFTYPLIYPELWPLFVLTAIAGLPFAAWGTAQMTLIQTGADAGTRARVFSLYFAVFGLTQLVGMLVSGVLGDRWGVWVINVDAVMYVLAGVMAMVALQRVSLPTASTMPRAPDSSAEEP